MTVRQGSTVFKIVRRCVPDLVIYNPLAHPDFLWYIFHRQGLRMNRLRKLKKQRKGKQRRKRRKWKNKGKQSWRENLMLKWLLKKLLQVKWASENSVIYVYCSRKYRYPSYGRLFVLIPSFSPNHPSSRRVWIFSGTAEVDRLEYNLGSIQTSYFWLKSPVWFLSDSGPVANYIAPVNKNLKLGILLEFF